MLALKRASARKRTTILRQFARKLAENANASERKFGLEKRGAARKMGYFLRFVRTVVFERRLLRMYGVGGSSPPISTIKNARFLGSFAFLLTWQSGKFASAYN